MCVREGLGKDEVGGKGVVGRDCGGVWRVGVGVCDGVWVRIMDCVGEEGGVEVVGE